MNQTKINLSLSQSSLDVLISNLIVSTKRLRDFVNRNCQPSETKVFISDAELNTAKLACSELSTLVRDILASPDLGQAKLFLLEAINDDLNSTQAFLNSFEEKLQNKQSEENAKH